MNTEKELQDKCSEISGTPFDYFKAGYDFAQVKWHKFSDELPEDAQNVLKLKTDYAILKNNFEFIEKENKELKEQIKKVKEWVKYNKYEDGCIDCDFTETDKLLEILRERVTE